MRTDKFIRLYLSHGSHELTRNQGRWDRGIYGQFLKLTEYLDFNCDFDETGLCQSRRGRYNDTDPKAAMCCCIGCRHTFGYLYNMTSNYSTLKRYAGMFNEDTGYWRAGVGCVLPRGMRSPTCVTYRCGGEKPNAAQTLLCNLLRMTKSNYSSGQYPFAEGVEVNGEVVRSDALVPGKLKDWLIKLKKKGAKQK